jgi:hypothetical protein
MKLNAFRQQFSRARRKFADFLIAEVSQTLRDQNQVEIRDELAELGFLAYVENFSMSAMARAHDGALLLIAGDSVPVDRLFDIKPR